MMGAWDTELFDNDSALDWLGDYEEANADQRTQLVTQALEVPDENNYFDSDEGCNAIAAVAVLAAHKNPALLPEGHNAAFLRALPEPTPQQSLAALVALDRVLAADSELLDLWGESGLQDTFVAQIIALKSYFH